MSACENHGIEAQARVAPTLHDATGRTRAGRRSGVQCALSAGDVGAYLHGLDVVEPANVLVDVQLAVTVGVEILQPCAGQGEATVRRSTRWPTGHDGTRCCDPARGDAIAVLWHAASAPVQHSGGVANRPRWTTFSSKW